MNTDVRTGGQIYLLHNSDSRVVIAGAGFSRYLHIASQFIGKIVELYGCVRPLSER